MCLYELMMHVRVCLTIICLCLQSDAFLRSDASSTITTMYPPQHLYPNPGQNTNPRSMFARSNSHHKEDPNIQLYQPKNLLHHPDKKKKRFLRSTTTLNTAEANTTNSMDLPALEKMLQRNHFNSDINALAKLFIPPSYW